MIVARDRRAAQTTTIPDPGEADRRERLLMEEFARAKTVASLAAAIAKRLGGRTEARDLVASAGLSSAPAPAVAAIRAQRRIKLREGIGP